MMEKKAQLSIDIIAGLIIFVAGLMIMFQYVNLGLLLIGLGTLVEAIKIVVSQGLK